MPATRIREVLELEPSRSLAWPFSTNVLATASYLMLCAFPLSARTSSSGSDSRSNVAGWPVVVACVSRWSVKTSCAAEPRICEPSPSMLTLPVNVQTLCEKSSPSATAVSAAIVRPAWVILICRKTSLFFSLSNSEESASRAMGSLLFGKMPKAKPGSNRTQRTSALLNSGFENTINLGFQLHLTRHQVDDHPCPDQPFLAKLKHHCLIGRRGVVAGFNHHRFGH